MKKLIILLMVLVSIQTVSAISDSWRTCNVTQPCMLGDFVYNDSYVPYTDQICTINISYPNGTMAVIDASMDNNSLGWHNYSYTPLIKGLFPVEIYCTNGIDVGREARSFIAILSGEGVWTYNETGRTTNNYFDKILGGDLLANEMLFLAAVISICLILGFNVRGTARIPFFMLAGILFTVWGLYIRNQTPFAIIGSDVSRTDIGLINLAAMWAMLMLSIMMFIYPLYGEFRRRRNA